ncbi:MAG: Ig-like domain-containing protein [bacterium]|nr:Ig-like domain-containing protein [bacterium]
MKRIISFITAIFTAASAACAVYADNTAAPADIQGAELAAEEGREAVSEENEEKIPPRYYRHVSRFGKIEGEEIRTDRNSYILYLDSDNPSTDMNAEVMPVNATDKELAFSSSDESVVTISTDGVITACKTGEATIYISSETLYKECRVEVRRAVKGISLSSSDLSFYADRPTTAKLTANVIPADATNKNVKWKSSDTSVAGVDSEGNVSTCGVGTATITAVTEDGGFKAQCTVRSTVYNITVKGVFITNPVEAIPVGTDYALTSMIYPESARNKAVSWSTSDSNIISVDGSGMLHANAEGYATITAAAENGLEDYFTLAAVTLNGEEQFEYVSTAVPVDERIAQLSVPVYYEDYQSSYDSALRTQLKNSPVVFTTNSRAASQAEVEQYLNPANSMKGYAKYQFLDLSSVSEVSARMLNVYLSDKGILKDKGEVFRAAAEESHVNAAYLAIHACLESGGGTSELACGIEYNGTTVYNLFGIGAYDDDPVNGGAKYAYEKGWTSIDAAIKGGADWISRSYINSGQNTLYKMRWNPSRPGQNQYATDVGWAAKQARTLQTFMEVFPISSLVFDVPVYAGQEKTPMRYE